MDTLRAHYFQHVPFEDPGYILNWLLKKGIKCQPPGFMNPQTFPWLREEKAFIKSAIDQNKTVIGICLGSAYSSFLRCQGLQGTGKRDRMVSGIADARSAPVVPFP